MESLWLSKLNNVPFLGGKQALHLRMCCQHGRCPASALCFELSIWRDYCSWWKLEVRYWTGELVLTRHVAAGMLHGARGADQRAGLLTFILSPLISSSEQKLCGLQAPV